jgi:hypothetical protein
MSVDTILMVLACICFGVAALNIAAPVNLVALGLLFWALTVLL